MVVDQFHVAGVRPVKVEDDAPVTGDLNRPVAGAVALQRMEPKAGQVHGLWCGGYVKVGRDAVDLPGET